MLQKHRFRLFFSAQTPKTELIIHQMNGFVKFFLKKRSKNKKEKKQPYQAPPKRGSKFNKKRTVF
jgi:hypothetical protein